MPSADAREHASLVHGVKRLADDNAELRRALSSAKASWAAESQRVSQLELRTADLLRQRDELHKVILGAEGVPGTAMRIEHAIRMLDGPDEACSGTVIDRLGRAAEGAAKRIAALATARAADPPAPESIGLELTRIAQLAAAMGMGMSLSYSDRLLWSLAVAAEGTLRGFGFGNLTSEELASGLGTARSSLESHARKVVEELSVRAKGIGSTLAETK